VISIRLEQKHAQTLLRLAYSYRRIAKEMETDLTVEQQEAIAELKYECASAKKAELRAKQ